MKDSVGRNVLWAWEKSSSCLGAAPSYKAKKGQLSARTTDSITAGPASTRAIAWRRHARMLGNDKDSTLFRFPTSSHCLCVWRHFRPTRGVRYDPAQCQSHNCSFCRARLPGSSYYHEPYSSLAGRRSAMSSTKERRARRWGKEASYRVVDSQKVPIRRPPASHYRQTGTAKGMLELFQCSGPMQASVWGKMMRGFRPATTTTALWCRVFRTTTESKIGGERKLHRGQPGKAKELTAVGTAVMRPPDRRDRSKTAR